MTESNDLQPGSVWGMMPRLTTLSVALAVVLLAGCQGKKDFALNPEPPKKEVPAPVKPDESNPLSQPITDPESFKVKPGKEIGYSASKMTFEDLGKKTDAGIQGLKNGKAIVVMQYESPKGKLNGNIDIKVRDNKTYVVEYLLPQTEVTPNRLVADGKSRMVYEDRKWSKAPTRDLAKGMSSKDVDTWIAHYPGEIMSGLQDGAPVWEKLLSALSTDPGRTTTVEEQETTVKNIKRPIYRVVSRRKGVSGDELEIVIDGHRWIPLTVKAAFHDEKKAPVHIFWTANWMFGGTFPDKDFEVPVK